MFLHLSSKQINEIIKVSGLFVNVKIKLLKMWERNCCKCDRETQNIHNFVISGFNEVNLENVIQNLVTEELPKRPILTSVSIDVISLFHIFLNKLIHLVFY